MKEITDFDLGYEVGYREALKEAEKSNEKPEDKRPMQLKRFVKFVLGNGGKELSYKADYEKEQFFNFTIANLNTFVNAWNSKYKIQIEVESNITKKGNKFFAYYGVNKTLQIRSLDAINNLTKMLNKNRLSKNAKKAFADGLKSL